MQKYLECLVQYLHQRTSTFGVSVSRTITFHHPIMGPVATEEYRCAYIESTWKLGAKNNGIIENSHMMNVTTKGTTRDNTILQVTD